MSENGEIYTAGKYFTLPLALTGWTNSTPEWPLLNTDVFGMGVASLAETLSICHTLAFSSLSNYSRLWRYMYIYV